MSKKLLKILAICIFVTLIPVAIVAIALTATQSAPYIINVELKGEEEYLNEYNQKLSISVNERLREGNRVGVKETDKVVITFEGDAYDVKGFYQGNPDSVSETSTPLEPNVSSYDFEVKGSANITIWVEPKTFELSFEFTNGETKISDLNTSYGKELPKVQGRDDFAGWMVKGANDNRVYQKATFDVKGEYVLIPVYSQEMKLQYYKNDELILEKVVYEHNYDEYQLLNENDEIVITNVDLGYKFIGWSEDASTDIIYKEKPEFKADQVYSLYLKQEVVEYSLKDVKFHINSTDTCTINFNMVNRFDFKNITRENYTLAGMIYNGEEYTKRKDFINDFILDGQSLIDILIQDINKGEDLTGKLTLVWENNYNKNSYNFYIYLRTINGNVYLDNKGENVVEKYEVTLRFDETEEYDLNTSLADLYINTLGSLYDENGNKLTIDKYTTLNVWPGQTDAIESEATIMNPEVTVGYLVKLIEDANTGVKDIIIVYTI